ncbi:hypothetical protein A2U01_0080133 [Trifolium medium]|uniref:Uncharacterized protein n=1 Tax=Trifolium medium TaxID=97028 RepID=A0A392TCY8_9FABA|nr:hypothetical protein [Trifolium medium]
MLEHECDDLKSCRSWSCRTLGCFQGFPLCWAEDASEDSLTLPLSEHTGCISRVHDEKASLEGFADEDHFEHLLWFFIVNQGP